jgi:hypothetical protein
MNLYQRVASANPQGSKRVIKNFGYEIRTNDLPQALKLLVKEEGEPALRAIVDIHPDKEIILECCGHTANTTSIEKVDKEREHYLNAVGSQLTAAQKETQLTNTFLIASTFIILTALILKH